MTIDMAAFEMTLDVLSQGRPASESEEVRDFFAAYQRETDSNLQTMYQYLERQEWVALKRMCHTWKGRNAQIGFRKCSWLAGDLHDFLRDVLEGAGVGGECALEARDCALGDEGAGTGMGMVARQVEAFLERMNRECQVIRAYLIREGYIAS